MRHQNRSSTSCCQGLSLLFSRLYLTALGSRAGTLHFSFSPGQQGPTASSLVNVAETSALSFLLFDRIQEGVRGIFLRYQLINGSVRQKNYRIRLNFSPSRPDNYNCQQNWLGLYLVREGCVIKRGKCCIWRTNPHSSCVLLACLGLFFNACT